MKLTFLLSFDHELSLGGTDSYTYNLFEPTELLLDLADNLSVPVILFTDVLCGIRFKEWDQSGFYVPYVKQLSSKLAGGTMYNCTFIHIG